ncbi:GTPase IMAP family member 8-like [Xyrauchen texanus]|uniref:GTPase IMAP family member 8-like n=1 Tax=Xyrauchen texanus TaxID=154827 RepID=UPI002241E947|nr:GTPase IMAP family member 8-like [Xyrauchen texanus]
MSVVENQTELRAALLGWHSSGKTSVINTILAASEVEIKELTDENVKREGFIDGKRVLLVETPGWWKEFSLNDLSNISKQQLVRRVSQCSPHAVIITIQADLKFNESDGKGLVEHVELLGPNVWAHAIVLFTRGDLIKEKDIERDIKRAGPALKRLIEKCGNEYHVFNNSNHHDKTQITELLEKMVGIVKKNDGKHFSVDLKKVKELNIKWGEIQTRARARKAKVQAQSSIIQDRAYVRRLEEIRVVLLGWVIAGKSLAGNTILNRDEFVTGGRTEKGTRGFSDVDGRKMTVLDTPGWWKYFASELNPDFVRSAILDSISECTKFPHAMILVIPADTSFQQEQRRIIQKNMAILGEDVWRHTIVLFTLGDKLPVVSIEEHIESEGDALQWLIEKCGNRYHVFDNTDRKNRDQVTQLLQKIDQMVAGNCLFHLDTTAKYSDVESHLQRTDTQENVTIEEIKLKDICHFLDEGINRKLKEIREKIESIWKDIMEENLYLDEYRSMDSPVNFRNESPKSSEPAEVITTPQQDRILEHIKTLLEREFSRWENVMISGVRKSLLDIKSFELSQEEKIQKSKDAVEGWLQNHRHYVEHTIEKIQDTESVIKPKRLKTRHDDDIREVT